MLYHTIRSTLGAAAFVATLIALAGAPAHAQTSDATTSDEAHVVVVNSSLSVLKIYAFEEEPADRELLGWVGHDELEFLRVPRELRADDGTYRIAVQRATPQPQIGASADTRLYATPKLSPEPDETIQITVDQHMELSQAVVR